MTYHRGTPTIDQVETAANGFYWTLMYWIDENRSAISDEQAAYFDVEVTDIIDRIKAIPICERCERAACWCNDVSS